MCCNADILFSVLVLHWVTQVDSARGSTGTGSSRQNASADNDRPGTATIHGVPRARHESTDIIDSSALWPNRNGELDSKSMPLGVITTECKGISMHQNMGSEDQIMELHKIRVHTKHTREIEIGGRSDSDTTETNEYNTYKGERSMRTEKMV
jgi:hypothetical protein